jgi:ubiquinone/menaquinone biosynthesis C-methylase UbiE
MSAIEQDFDQLALLDSEGWNHNSHYHNFLLRHVPDNCGAALEVGCGTGAFARRLANRVEDVVAIDLSSEMIRVARSRSAAFPNIDFQVADANSWRFPAEHFDCITTIATLHHLPLRETISKLKKALRPGGVLSVLDLFQPEGPIDAVTNILAFGASGTLRLIHNGRLNPPRAVQAAWEAHGRRDSYLRMREVGEVAAQILPGAKLRRHLFWRYSIIWRKPSKGAT